MYIGSHVGVAGEAPSPVESPPPAFHNQPSHHTHFTWPSLCDLAFCSADHAVHTFAVLFVFCSPFIIFLHIISNINEIFEKIIRAFDLADKYQLPVIVLTDQFLLDSRFSVNEMDLKPRVPAFYLADPSTIKDYKRFQLTDNGISPRLYPGQSAHLVTADSDEHDPDGHITEDLSGAALAMMKKRLVKFQGLKTEIAAPEEINVDQAETVMVGWGSSRQAIREALEHFNADGVQVGMIHFTEIWPLPEYNFPQGKHYWSVENNATSQLARLLRSEYGITFTGSINRYDGLPLTGNYVRRCFHE